MHIRKTKEIIITSIASDRQLILFVRRFKKGKNSFKSKYGVALLRNLIRASSRRRRINQQEGRRRDSITPRN